MRRAVWAIFVLALISVVSLTVETSCRHLGPIDRCRGTSVNRRFLPGTRTPEYVCTECIELNCCDLIGDCQDNDCANQVGTAHECVEDAGRAAAVVESDCRQALEGNQSKKVYQCMRDKCGEQCRLPTCRLEPLVPPLGEPRCDRCFAQGCCDLMNACAKNRKCLLALSCIVDKCRAEFGDELGIAQLGEAQVRKDILCDGGGPPPGVDLTGDDGPGQGCFGQCIVDTLGREQDDPEAAEARCLAAQINECGAQVDCGRFCRIDASAPPADAGSDAPSDAPAD